MRRMSLLIVDSAVEFCTNLAGILEKNFHVSYCHEGKKALEILLDQKPDFIVIDLMISGMDGISILQAAARKGVHPTILASAPLYSDYIVSVSRSMHFGYLLTKPCDEESVAERVLDLCKSVRPPVILRDPRTEAAELIQKLGIPSHLRGNGYLREAIAVFYERPGISVTKELYPNVGFVCGATRHQVERSIRNAIDQGWQRMDFQVWSQYFPPDQYGVIERPSNGTFIARLAEEIRFSVGR